KDPSRVLRGLQMCGRFGLKVHPETAKLCKGMKKDFSKLSSKVIKEELEKWKKSKQPYKGIQYRLDRIIPSNN
ncbi:hypothetical protein V6O07_00440, partial [Arthrospira platensis SPKY2]